MKGRISVVTIGHVDHGKSTLLGRLLLEKGVVTPEEVARLARQAALVGKESFQYAWVLDRGEESRARGLTMDLGYADLQTRNRKVHLIDAPGHQDFVRSMITGTTGADAALLVVDASEGIMPQTREHAQLAAAMGLRQVVVALNKADRVGYDAAKVGAAAKEMRDFLEPFGFARLDVIPVSAWEGENLTARSAKMSWYRGRTLEEALDGLEARPAANEGSLRMPIMDVITVGGVGTVAVGRIERGTLKEDEEVVAEPAEKRARVKSIEVHGQGVGSASAGETVGVALRNVAKTELSRGDVLGPEDDPPLAVDAFEARLAVTGEIGHAGIGWTATLHCHAASVPVRLDAILSSIDPSSGEELATAKPYLSKGDVARVRFVPTKPVVLEGPEHGPALGRFALRVGKATVGAGSVVTVTPHEKKPGPGQSEAGFSFKHQKTGAAARKKKEEISAKRRDIHGRPLKGK
ncbi:MAG: GTP-binding protein [Thermoplasmatota archaeon]